MKIKLSRVLPCSYLVPFNLSTFECMEVTASWDAIPFIFDCMLFCNFPTLPLASRSLLQASYYEYLGRGAASRKRPRQPVDLTTALHHQWTLGTVRRSTGCLGRFREADRDPGTTQGCRPGSWIVLSTRPRAASNEVVATRSGPPPCPCQATSCSKW